MKQYQVEVEETATTKNKVIYKFLAENLEEAKLLAEQQDWGTHGEYEAETIDTEYLYAEIDGIDVNNVKEG
jgi:hypothetical protein